MYQNYKIVAVTLSGRRRFLNILQHYMLRDRGIVDEWHLWMNTPVAEDIEYMKSLQKTYPDYIKIIDKSINYPETASSHYHIVGANISSFYNYCIDPKTLYIKLDDDIVFVEEGTFEYMVRNKISHPEIFLIYPNIINNPITSYVLQRQGVVDTSRGVCTSDDTRGEISVCSEEFATNVHTKFINHAIENSIGKYHFKQWLLHNYERASINCICFCGEDLWKVLPIKNDDEGYLTTMAPISLKKYNAFFGEKIVSHFSFLSQGTLQESTDLIKQYEQLLNINL